MKRLMKKTISIVCVMAMFFTGLAFAPQSVGADDVWYDLVGNWSAGIRQCEVPDGETSIWTYEKDGNTEIKCANAYTIQGFKWQTVVNGEACFFKTTDLKDVACVSTESGLVKPSANKFYNLHAKIKYTPPDDGNHTAQMTVETKGGLGDENIPFTQWKVKQSKTNPDTTQLEQEVDGIVCMVEGLDFQFCINYGFLSDSQKFKMQQGIIEITEFSLTEESGWNVVPSNEDYAIANTPWSARANYNPVNPGGSYGITWYRLDEGASASYVSGTTFKLRGTVGVQETYPADYPDVEKRNKPVDSADRWWWTSATLKNYLPKAGVQYLRNKYTGTIVLNSTKATEGDCKLFVYVDGKEYPFSITEGRNTLSIPEFTYKEDDQTTDDIKFLFDEMPKNTDVNIESVEFTRVDDGWTNVPNMDPDFTVGPWNMVATYDVKGLNEQTQEVEGIFGALQYKANKANPSEYSDYTVKVLSNSNWIEEGVLKYSAFTRLENYCADYLDEGDEYDITIKLNSTKATVPSPKPNILDQLVVVVGSDVYYRDLVAGSNTIRLQGTYNWDKDMPHEQILLNLDGLQLDTEITVTDIQINGPNNGWTNVPNKRQTSVGMWTTLAEWSATRWSKLAYRPNASGSGLSAYDFKTRRTSKDYTLEASMAWLNDYLATAKDTKGNALDNGDPYAPTITMTAGGLGDSVSNYGKMWVNINGTRFSFDVKKGNNTYDLRQLTGNALVYSDENAQDVEFYFDELEDKSVINISKIEFAPLTEPGEDIPNGEAVSPEGTPWTLYAITNPSSGQYGALKYSIDGNPSDLSSLKLYVKSVSGAFIANATFAHLTDYLNNLKNGQNYKITINVAIDESSVVKRDVPYNKQLRVIVNEQNMDFDIPDTPGATTTLQRVFEYDSSKDKDISFQLDQLLQGTKFSVKSIVIEETTDPTQGPTTVNPTTENPSSVDPTSEGPTGTDTSTAVTSSKNDTTTNVVIPGKTKIKKIYKKKKSAKKLKLKLKKVKGAKGYQIAVYKSKKKAKKNKKALVKKFVKYKKKIVIKSKKLKKKKKLYVRARAYVLDADKVKVFGKWSPIKKAKIK